MNGCPVCPGPQLRTRRYDLPDHTTAYLECPVCGWEVPIPFRDLPPDPRVW